MSQTYRNATMYVDGVPVGDVGDGELVIHPTPTYDGRDMWRRLWRVDELPTIVKVEHGLADFVEYVRDHVRSVSQHQGPNASVATLTRRVFFFPGGRKARSARRRLRKLSMVKP